MRYTLKMKLLWAVMLILPVLPITRLSAQDLKMSGFTLGDTTVYFNPSEEPHYIDINVGSRDPSTRVGYCTFYWEVVETPTNPNADCFFNDVSSPTPILRCFTCGTYVVQATRVSKYGYQTEAFCIDMTSEITLISARDKVGCWESGDPIKPSDFDLVTSPVGFERLVRVVEDKVGVTWFGNCTVHFQVENPQDGSLEDSDVTENIWVSYGADATGIMDDVHLVSECIAWFSVERPELAKNFKKFVHFTDEVKEIKKYASKFDKVKDVVKKIGKGTSIQPITTEEASISVSLGTQCCDLAYSNTQKTPVLFANVDGDIELGMGFKAYIPLYPPVPKLGINLTVGAYLGIESHTGFTLTSQEGCGSIYIDFALVGEGNIGVALVIADPDILALGAEGYVGFKGLARLQDDPPYMELKGFKMTGGMRVYGTFCGLNKEFVDISFTDDDD